MKSRNKRKKKDRGYQRSATMSRNSSTNRTSFRTVLDVTVVKGNEGADPFPQFNAHDVVSSVEYIYPHL